MTFPTGQLFSHAPSQVALQPVEGMRVGGGEGVIGRIAMDFLDMSQLKPPDLEQLDLFNADARQTEG